MSQGSAESNLRYISAGEESLASESIGWVSIPYIMILLLELVLLFVFPGLATWLPGQVSP